MNEPKISRRRLLKGALAGFAAVPAATLVAGSAAAAEPLLETDQTAKSLAYVTDASKVNAKANPTYKPGQTCANCLQYSGKPNATEGPCTIFPNKTVKAAGWCKVWMIKPGAKLG
jgi:hypothetical protein